jgi:hypothetical protein
MDSMVVEQVDQELAQEDKVLLEKIAVVLLRQLIKKHHSLANLHSLILTIIQYLALSRQD